jgi:2-C-methyl-D-erythritol 4-phosphate cytidylyltransferase
MKQAVIIVAGGRGKRMGRDLPKQFIPLHGRPVLMHTVEVFHRWNPAAALVLVLPAAHQDYWRMLCRELRCEAPHRIVTGGETRFHSVRNGLQETGDCEIVGIHDGVRPLVAPEVIEACFVAAQQRGAAIPAIPVAESIREQDGEGGSRPADRDRFCIVQTPQVFRRDWLTEAYRQPCCPHFTDDATVVEATGKTIFLVPGNRENIKITTPFDLAIAEKIMGDEQKVTFLESLNP